jgi:hypothetical protein
VGYRRRGLVTPVRPVEDRGQVLERREVIGDGTAVDVEAIAFTFQTRKGFLVAPGTTGSDLTLLGVGLHVVQRVRIRRPLVDGEHTRWHPLCFHVASDVRSRGL